MSQRQDRVNELLRREISAVLQRDYEWPGQLVTVSEVEITQDFREARVWMSIFGGHVQPVLDRLNRDHGRIQSKVMKRVVLKSTPILTFRHDNSAVTGVNMVNLLQEVDQIPKALDADDHDGSDISER
ncbi:MAG: 30S ribosome-binding factor RbfA [Verrucomicrobia bacterium]|jgi:ribosome-binding factor A|nr:MAG: 30S ribosome-binding factor RbfA [Verrucomicrobiota bacterium]